MTNEEEERIVREHDARLEREKEDRSKIGVTLLIAATVAAIVLVAVFIMLIRRTWLKSMLG